MFFLASADAHGQPDQVGRDLEVVERIITPEPITSLPLAAPPPVPDSEGPSARLVGLQVAVVVEKELLRTDPIKITMKKGA